MICSFSECGSKNRDTTLYTVDHVKVHYFCRDHWRFISYLFYKIVGGCCKSDRQKKCARNHKAEFDETQRKLRTVKYNGRYFDLCDSHIATYEELVGLDTMFGSAY